MYKLPLPQKDGAHIPYAWICAVCKTNRMLKTNIVSILSQVLRRPRNFYILKSRHHVIRKPKQPCEEAHVENNQDPGPTILAELPAKSQHQLATCVSYPFPQEQSLILRSLHDRVSEVQ